MMHYPCARTCNRIIDHPREMMHLRNKPQIKNLAFLRRCNWSQLLFLVIIIVYGSLSDLLIFFDKYLFFSIFI